MLIVPIHVRSTVGVGVGSAGIVEVTDPGLSAHLSPPTSGFVGDTVPVGVPTPWTGGFVYLNPNGDVPSTTFPPDSFRPVMYLKFTVSVSPQVVTVVLSSELTVKLGSHGSGLSGILRKNVSDNRGIFFSLLIGYYVLRKNFRFSLYGFMNILIIHNTRYCPTVLAIVDDIDNVVGVL